ncbi:DUF6069 family protein [Streptomyces albipurpureus]|uniref:DUF6069 family protein n=1 Tax=Streptomyces albipurpureus TaxID=2897419 RepID=A0ABT0UN72_9ACTN|nr:DUF6069 family protein [Streptomyces sp. CWNU-1]MCM2388706.1 DUF6069 family protein [Streptomyces sp. CWNU-1]
MSARRSRLAVAGLAVLAPVLVWLVADPVLGHRLRISNGEEKLDIGAVAVVLAALLAALAGWGLLAALERFGLRRARAVWAGVAFAVLALSFLPLAGDGMDGGTRAALALMHLAVAAVLIPGLRMKDVPAATPPALSVPQTETDGGSPARESHGRG